MSDKDDIAQEGPTLPMRIVWVLTIPAWISQAWLQIISDERMAKSNYAALFALTLSWYALLWGFHFLAKGSIYRDHPDWDSMEAWQLATMISTGLLCLAWWVAPVGL